MNRYNFIKFLVIFLFTIIILRLIYLIFINTSYKDIFNNYVYKEIYGTSGTRGKIYDRNGKLLVDNIGVKSVYYKNSKNKLSVLKELTDILDINYNTTKSMKIDLYMDMYPEKVNELITKDELESYYLKKLTDNDLIYLKRTRISDDELNTISDKMSYIYYLMNNGYSSDEKLIKKGISDEIYAKLLNLNLDGVILKLSYERNYIYNDTLIGIFGSISKEEVGIPDYLYDYYKNKGYSTFDIVGISGIEYMYEDYLKGEKSIYKRNINGVELIKESVNGNDLYLTIDIDIQNELDKIITEELINTKKEANTEYFNSAYAIITNPLGEVLALSAKVINNGIVYDYTSHILSSSFTVGSVVKASSISVGYNENIIDIGTVIEDKCVKLGINEKCSWKTLGLINDIDALRLSSNVYQYKIAMNLFDNNTNYFNIYRSMFNSYGLGVKSGIDLPNEYTGIKGNKETLGLLLDYVIGQYDTYTLLELSSYINTIINNGDRYSLNILKEVKNNNDVIYVKEKELLNKVNIDIKYMNRIKEGFKSVLSYNGLGYGYIDINKNPSGKTGTSQSFYDSDNDGIIDKQTITSTFVGYFPSDNPKYSISVITPNVSHIYGSNYMSYVNKRITRRITDYLS